MVKRVGKEVITPEIFKETYDAMKIILTRRRWSAKDYINTLLMEAIERDKFLKSYVLSKSKVTYEKNILFIRDSKTRKSLKIFLRNWSLQSNVCKSKTVPNFTLLFNCQNY